MHRSVLGVIGIFFVFAFSGCGGSGGGSTTAPVPAVAVPPTNTGGSAQRFNPANAKISEVLIPAQPQIGGGTGQVQPGTIDVASDGSVYFGQSNGTSPAPFGLFRYAGGTFTETIPFGGSQNVFVGGVEAIDAHDLPTVFWSSVYWQLPNAIPQGDNLECGGNGGTATPCSFAATMPLNGYILSMLIGPGGTLWAGGSGAPGGVAIASPAQLPSDTNALYANGVDLAKGPNGHVWGLLSNVGGGRNPEVYEFSAGGSLLNTYQLRAGTQVFGNHALIQGADGALWFTDAGHNAIGRITASGSLTEYPIPTSNSIPWDIALAADGGMWFTESNAAKIGRIDTTGKIYEFNVPTADARPTAIAAPPAPSSCNPSQVWFTEYNTGKIASITY